MVLVKGLIGWLEITWQTHGVAWAGPIGGMEVPLHMKFLWMNSEHVTMDVMHRVLFEAAGCFYDRVGWCLVYSPAEYMRTASIVARAIETKLAWIGQGTAVSKFQNMILNSTREEREDDLRPAELPIDALSESSDDEEWVSS